MNKIGDENNNVQNPQEKPDEISNSKIGQPEQSAAPAGIEQTDVPLVGDTQPATEQPDAAGTHKPKPVIMGLTTLQCVIIVAIAVLAFFAMLLLPRPGGREAGYQEEAISVRPLIYDETGVAPNTAFQIRLPGVPEAQVAAGLIVIETESLYTFDITPLPDAQDEFLLTPRIPLEKNSRLTITVGGVEFAFDVRNELIITGVFPANRAWNVPVGSSIVLTFNTTDPVMDLFDSMSVFRSQDGHYENFRVLPQEGREIHITPTYPLRYNTAYQIVISPPLEDAGGAQLLQPFEFMFNTASEGRARDPHTRWTSFELSGGAPSFNIIADDIPVLPVGIHGLSQTPAVSVTVRTFDGWEAFYAASLYGEEADAESLPIFAEYENVAVEEFNWRQVIVFPETLPVGWYHVEVTVDSNELEVNTRSILLQVSDISVFYMTTGDEVIVWAHDILTGQPLSGAEVSFSGDFVASGQANTSGVLQVSGVQIADPDEELDWWSRRINKRFTVTYGDRVFVAGESYGDQFRDSRTTDVQRRYISYIYTDRDIFRTTDTIKVWGVVQPRDLTSPLPAGLELVLDRSRITLPITLLPDGTFTAEIELESAAPQSWEWLRLQTSGGDVLHSRNITINDFVAPIFRAGAQPDQLVFLLDEQRTAGATINVSMFDGTPAGSYPLSISSWGQNELELLSEGLVTDRNGNLAVELQIVNDRNSWRPRSYTFSFRGVQAADENVNGRGTIWAIHRDVMLTGNLNRAANTMEVTTHGIDISGVHDVHVLWNADALRGRPLVQEVTATMTRVYFVREQTGTFYDRVHRETRNRYRLVRQEEVLETRTFTAQGGSYTLTNLPTPREREYIIVALGTQDSLGRPVETRVSIWPSGVRLFENTHEEDGVHRYSLTLNHDPEFDNPEYDEDAHNAWWGWGSNWWRFYGNRNTFVDGQGAVFALRNNSHVVEDTTGFILSAVVQDGFSSVSVIQGNEVAVPFDESLVPNYIVTGAFFDGRHIFDLGNTYMSFNPERRELEITLEPDSRVYAPGDEMQVTVNVRDAFTGLPAANTVVLLSVVDEAIFAVREQHTNLIRSLYREIFFPRIHRYTSFTQLQVFGQGGGGGDGDQNLRQDFPDTAHFAATTTDEYGNALITVRVPDSITSWRLTSLAVSPQGHAGNTRMNVSATLDYFVMPIVNQTLLDGDSFVVGLFSAGTQVEDDDPVSYTVRLVGEGVDMVRETTSTVRGYASVDFGRISLGEYTVMVTGQSGQHRDSMLLPVQVVASGVETSRVETFNLSDGIEIDPLRWPVSIVFYNENARTYNAVFRSVVSRSWSSWRTEARLARRFIASRNTWYREAFGQEDISNITGRQILQALPHANQNIELTVLAHLALPEMLELSSFGPLEYRQLEGRVTPDFIARALTGQEFDVDLAQHIEHGAGLDHIDRIYLAMAMYISGDTAGANSWYYALVEGRLNRHVGVDGTTALSITDPAGTSTESQATAAALMLATLIGHDDAHGLALYLTRRPRSGDPHLLEKIFYLQNFSPSGGEPTSFSYQLGGETITHTITDGTVRISLNRSEFESADFTLISGQVYADVYFVGSPEQTADESSRRIGLTKTLEPVDGVFEPGGLVRITLTPDLSAFDIAVGNAMLVIDDYVPTGMRFEHVYRPPSDHSWRGWWLASRQGQRLQFSAVGGWEVARNYRLLGPIIYYARIATPGEYVVESAFISSAISDTWGASERSTVVIG
ncbi:MAG: Ig-like domain-containing protein [Oscillospiraceae bacterium]|nr:Ig-like domain-containing protein [Oscillospiraceae bacterium]